MTGNPIRFFENPIEFLRLVKPALARDETKNNLVLGLALTLSRDPMAFGEKPLLAVGQNSPGRVALAALQTPPHPLLVFSDPPDLLLLEALVLRLLQEGILPGGVNGVAEASGAFAMLWEKHSGQNATQAGHMRAYELMDVIPPNNPPVGSLRVAESSDFETTAGMLSAMHAELDLLGGRNWEERLLNALSASNVFLWEAHGEPVSMAMANRPQIEAICIGGVFTPKAYRRQGFAAANVAAASRLLLDRGYRLVNLFTDLANPTSNKIYQEIGFKPVCDYHQYTFC